MNKLPFNNTICRLFANNTFYKFFSTIPGVCEKHTARLSIEGNIGAGKSTLLQVLTKNFGDELEIKFEPVDRWKDCRGSNLLEAFYKDPKRYAYTFQSFAFITRMMDHVQTRNILVFERSPLSDYCFAKNCYDLGLMNDLEWNVYQEWWSHFTKILPSAMPEGIIFLNTSPEKCLERVNTRSRSEEKTLELSYLIRLHEQHQEWFSDPNEKDKFNNLPFTVLDGDKEFGTDEDAQLEMIYKIKRLIEQVKSNKN